LCAEEEQRKIYATFPRSLHRVNGNKNMLIVCPLQQYCHILLARTLRRRGFRYKGTQIKNQDAAFLQGSTQGDTAEDDGGQGQADNRQRQKLT